MKWILFMIVPFMFSYADTLSATYSAVLGNNDTRASVRQTCYDEATRLLVEKVGSFISSRTTIENCKMTVDKIQAFSAGLIKVVDRKDDVSFVNGTLSFTVYLRAYVDPRSVERELKKEMERDSIINAPVKEHTSTVVNNYYTVVRPDLPPLYQPQSENWAQSRSSYPTLPQEEKEGWAWAGGGIGLIVTIIMSAILIHNNNH